MEKKSTFEDLTLEGVISRADLGIGVLRGEEILYSNQALQRILQGEFGIRFPSILYGALQEGKVMGTEKIGRYTFGFWFEKVGDAWLFLVKPIPEETVVFNLRRDKEIVDNLNRLFSAIRHEIGNPINIVKMSIKVVKEHLDEFSEEKRKEYLGRITKQVEAIEQVLNTIGNFMRVGTLNITRVEISSYLQDFLKEVEGELVARKVKLKVDDEMPKIWVEADPYALKQVLRNIFKNSVEAMDGYKGKRRIEVSLERVGDYARLSINNTGKKIPSDLINKLFIPFTSTKGKKRGMGLAISKRLMLAMNGELEISNEIDGVETRIYLPIAKVHSGGNDETQ